MSRIASLRGAGVFALMNPGAAREYFTRRETPAFEPGRTDYSPANAWWLAELSRMVYCENPAVRSRALTKVKLRKLDFFDKDNSEGLVAEARDGSFAVLVFRGTSNIMDWVTNIQASPTKWTEGGHVHEGFEKALLSVWTEIERFLPKDKPLFYAGHSLGAALATLAASRRPPQAVYTFGSPHVGDGHFAATLRGSFTSCRKISPITLPSTT